MKYRVYYADDASTEAIVEASDHRSAAKHLFSQHPKTEDCRITVETKSFLNYSVEQFHVTEFMDQPTRESLGQSAPLQPPTAPSTYAAAGPPERGSASLCVWLGVIFLAIGAWFLLNPSTEFGGSLQSSGFPAFINIHRLYIGQTSAIVGAIFLAVGIRPRM